MKAVGTKSRTESQEVALDVVVPFYLYAGIFLLISCVMLIFSTGSFQGHHFQPDLLAITHAMALGWGTMVILGASYQLIPVLVESRLRSFWLARGSFLLAGLGIPFLVYGFYTFNLGWVTQVGAVAINVAIILYIINLAWSVAQSKTENIHAIYMMTASCWMLVTTLLGLVLLLNFTMDLLPQDSLHYLSTHAHSGIVGWFLLLVIGVGSRLIPMFLISKYANERLLWTVYTLVNLGLLLLMAVELNPRLPDLHLLSLILIGGGIGLFLYYLIKAYKKRIRRKVDGQIKLSLASVGMFVIPLTILCVVIAGTETPRPELVTAYGFCVFFGWLTAIILGMTFKTLPFIVWSKVYRHQSGKQRHPDPKDLFDPRIYQYSMWLYMVGFIGFLLGILVKIDFLLIFSAPLMILSSILYVWNVLKVVFHKAKRHDKPIGT
ncbi:MAG TPA: hypothetical protein VKX33_12340 [Cyclobacteriaceae bacterium]|nr:hypothetical protein [Cyclobacteriaceae bacterium]